MTEENQKKLYDHFIKTGQTEKAKAITDVPRYAKFAPVKKEEETKSKVKK